MCLGRFVGEVAAVREVEDQALGALVEGLGLAVAILVLLVQGLMEDLEDKETKNKVCMTRT